MSQSDEPGIATATRELLTRAEALLRSGDATAALSLLEAGRAACSPSEYPHVDRLIGNALLALNRRGEAYTILQAALANPVTADDDALYAQLLNALGSVYHADGQLQAAIEAFGRALHYAERLRPPDQGLRARILTNLGVAAAKAGQVEASTIYYERAIEAAREADDPRRLGMAHMGLGMARQEARDYDQALSHAAQAMTLFQKAGERRLEAQALTNLALAHAAQEHWAEAVPHLQRALARAREDGDLAHQAHILELLARARAFVGDHAGAVELAGEARVLAEREDDRLEAGAAALTEATALSALQRREEAEERYRMALEYLRAGGASRRFMTATRAYAAALRDWGRTDEALEILDQAYSTVINLRQG